MVDDPYLRLVAAVIVKAMLDAHKGEREAWEWLHGEMAQEWALMLCLRNFPPSREQLGEIARARRSMNFDN
jgi:hypothetical protein